jgi:hypothetical protein
MPTLLDDWQRMRAGLPVGTGSGYALNLRVSRADLRVYLALQRPALVPALVVEFPATIRPRSLTSFTTRAFEVVLAAFPGLPAGHVGVAVNLLDATFDDLFAALAGEILESVSAAATPNHAMQAINHCISRWRRFVDSGRRGLTAEEMRGLIGELVILGRSAQRIGFRNALDAWRAPFESIRDFEFDSSSLEVKTYQVHAGPSLRINDPAQLEPSVGRPLYLCGVRLAPTESGRTLPEVIEVLREAHAMQPSELTQFEESLASYGYFQSLEKSFTDRFAIGPVSVFEVRDGFPRIRPTSVPAGVQDVRFAIPLGAMAQFEVLGDTTIGPPLSGLEAIA